jgi:hypothetical protein
MNRSTWITAAFTAFVCMVCWLPIQAGEIPPGTQIAPKGKPISGQGMIIKIDDETYTYVIVGTCKKEPFQLGPIVETGTFDTIVEEDFYQFFFYDSVPAECHPPDNYQGYAVTGVEDLYFLTDVISGKVILQAVIPDPSP